MRRPLSGALVKEEASVNNPLVEKEPKWMTVRLTHFLAALAESRAEVTAWAAAPYRAALAHTDAVEPFEQLH